MALLISRSTIKGDNLIERMVEAKMKLRYAGPEWSFLALLGSENYDRLFEQIDLNHEPLVCGMADYSQRLYTLSFSVRC
jgi:hypothetical protein